MASNQINLIINILGIKILGRESYLLYNVVSLYTDTSVSFQAL